MKVKDVVSVFKILKEASLDGLASDAKMAVVKNMLTMKKYVNDYDSDAQLAKEKTITKEAVDAFNEIEHVKVNGAIPWANMNDEERSKFIKNSQIVSKAENECNALIGELDNKEIEDFTMTKIGDEAVSKLIDGNSLNVENAMVLVEFLS